MMVFIYNGKQVIELDRNCDDYGALPSEFKIMKRLPNNKIIPPIYWHDTQRNFWGGPKIDYQPDEWRGIVHN